VEVRNLRAADGHWKKVVDIYTTGDKERLAEAKSKLRAAEKALNKTRQEVTQ
jgi:hypothetical protein